MPPIDKEMICAVVKFLLEDVIPPEGRLYRILSIVSRFVCGTQEDDVFGALEAAAACDPSDFAEAKAIINGLAAKCPGCEDCKIA